MERYDPHNDVSVSPIVGRAAQMELLDRALAKVAGRTVVVVEISGEPGIGKTRLLTELGMRAAAAGLPTGTGRATEYAKPEPLSGYLDILGVDLARGPDGPADALPPKGRFRVYAAVRRLLENAYPDGIALLLDDMHRADRLSLEL